MHRVGSGTRSINKHGAGKHGFTDTAPSDGVSPTVPATHVTNDWLDSVQESIATVIEDHGATLDKTDNRQLSIAMQEQSARSLGACNYTLQESAGDFITAIVYDDNSELWCAVGSNARIETSPDGITWTTRTAASAYVGNITDIAYDGTSRICFCGASGEIQSSDDGGATWSQRKTGGVALSAISHNGTDLWVAGGTDTDVETSADGATWANSARSMGTGDLQSLDFGGGLWVAVVNEAATEVRLYSSPDGLAWTLRETTLSDDSSATVRYGNGLWNVIGADFPETSTDAITWTTNSYAPIAASIFQKVDYNAAADLWIGCGTSATGVGAVFVSYDGFSWYWSHTAEIAPISMANNGALYIYSGGSGGDIYRSDFITPL